MEERVFELSEEEVENLKILTSAESIHEYGARPTLTVEEWTTLIGRAIYGPCEDMLINYGSVSAAIRATLIGTGEDYVQTQRFESALNNVILACQLFDRQDVSVSDAMDRALDLIQDYRPATGYERVLALVLQPTAIPSEAREPYLIRFISILYSYLPSPPRDKSRSQSFEYLTQHLCIVVKNSTLPKEARSFAAAALIACGALDGSGYVRYSTREAEYLLTHIDVGLVLEALRDLLYGPELKRSEETLNAMIRRWGQAEKAAKKLRQVGIVPTKRDTRQTVDQWLELCKGASSN